MEDSQDVFSQSVSVDPNLTRVPGLMARSSASLPTLQSQDLNTVRSRRPLSHSDASAIQHILNDRSLSCGSCSKSLVSKSNESGFFSDSPGGSRLSLYQISEMQKTMLHEAGLPEEHEIDEFNKNNLGPLLIEIAEEFGGCWREMGRYLLKKECSVENIDADYSKVSEKAYQILRKWKEEQGCNASVIELFKCFNRIGKEDIAEKVLQYLPDPITNACEMILLSSPKKIRCPSMITVIYNIEETFKDLVVEKQLRLASGEDDLEVYLCASKITRKKYIIKEIEEGPNNYILAARLAIPEKQLNLRKRKLRKTTDFVKDIQFKEDTVKRLKDIVEKLQTKLQVDYFNFCKEDLDCSNCEKTKTKQELLEKDLSLLHYALDKMLYGNRRLSVSGIPTERIYELADRAYGICEDHKKMHSEITKMKRRCSQEFLDVEVKQPEKDDKEDTDIDDSLKCTLNILQHFARRRKVVQSLTVKQRKESKKVQRNKSDKSKSRFYVPVLDKSFLDKGGDQAQTTSWLARNNSKKNTKRSFKNKDSRDKVVKRKSAIVERPVKSSFHPRTNTSPASIVCMNGNKTDFVGPEDLDLDDLDDAASLSLRVKCLRMKGQSSHQAKPKTTTTGHSKIHKCNSDPYLRNANPLNSHNPLYRERDGHGVDVFDILAQDYYSERLRSHSDAQFTQYNKLSQKCDQVAFKDLSYANKPIQKREQPSSKGQSDAMEVSTQGNKPSQERDQTLSKNQSDAMEVYSNNNKPSQERDACKSQSDVMEVSFNNNKPSQKRDQITCKSQSDAMEVSSNNNKPSQKRDQVTCKSQSDAMEVSSNNNQPSQKCDQVTRKSQSDAMEVSSNNNQPSQKCDQVTRKSQSDVMEVSSNNNKPSQKRDQALSKSQSDAMKVSSNNNKPSQKRDQVTCKSQSESQKPVSECDSVSYKSKPVDMTSDGDVKWLKDIDTEKIYFV